VIICARLCFDTPPPWQVEVDWISRVVRWSVDGAEMAVAVPADWTSRRLRVWLVVWNHAECTATLLQSSCISAAASPTLPARAGSSASGITKGRHTAAAASALH